MKQSEQDYRTYKKQRGELESQLAQLEADYNSGAPGVNYADIIDMRELLADVNSDEDWYIAGIALATANVVSKTTGLVQQSAAAAQSTATYGFNAGIQLDIDASNTKSELEQTSSLASTLSGNNINILTGLAQGLDRGAASTALGMTLIQGSHLNAKNAINISTGELSVLASRDTSSSSETQNGHITIAQTIGGAAGGPTVSASYDRNQTKDKTTTYNNATLTAADINIITAGDTRIEGANLTADNRLNLDVGGDLLLESKQNRASGSNKGFGVSGGFSFNAGNEAPDSVSSAVGGALSSLAEKTVATTNIGDTSGGVGSVNGGLNASAGRYQNKETVLSSITGSEVKVNVAGNTNIVGALLASLGADGKDNGKLSLTTGSLSFTDLTNTRFNSQVSGGISANIGITTQTTQANDANANANANAKATANTLPATKVTGDGETSSNSLDVNSSQYSYSNESSYDKSKTLATLGQGTVLVGGVSIDGINISGANVDAINPAQGTASNVLAGLNRDTDNIDKTFYSVDRQQGNIDLTVDHEQVAVAAEAVADAVVFVKRELEVLAHDLAPEVELLFPGINAEIEANIRAGIDVEALQEAMSSQEMKDAVKQLQPLVALAEENPDLLLEALAVAKNIADDNVFIGDDGIEHVKIDGKDIPLRTEILASLGVINTAVKSVLESDSAMVAGILIAGIRGLPGMIVEAAVGATIGDEIEKVKAVGVGKITTWGTGRAEGEFAEDIADEERYEHANISRNIEGGAELVIDAFTMAALGLGALKKGHGDSGGNGAGDVDSNGGRSENNSGAEGNVPNTNGTQNHNAVVMEPEADFAGNVGNLRQHNQDSLSEHMVNARLTDKGDSIYGGHDMSNFYRQLDESGGNLTEPPVQIAPGMYDVKYKLPTTRESFTPRKTLYDPEVYPNMANLAEAAGHKALTQFKLTGNLPETTTVGGIVFKTPINTRGDIPTVPSVFPIGVSQ